jgi:hypothetical protein
MEGKEIRGAVEVEGEAAMVYIPDVGTPAGSLKAMIKQRRTKNRRPRELGSELREQATLYPDAESSKKFHFS